MPYSSLPRLLAGVVLSTHQQVSELIHKTINTPERGLNEAAARSRER
jgi:hypothetical protein